MRITTRLAQPGALPVLALPAAGRASPVKAGVPVPRVSRRVDQPQAGALVGRPVAVLAEAEAGDVEEAEGAVVEVVEEVVVVEEAAGAASCNSILLVVYCDDFLMTRGRAANARAWAA